MKTSTAVLLLFLFLFSCEKSDLEISYPSIYFKSGIRAIGTTSVFSNQGEIRDAIIANRFYERDTSRLTGIARNLETDLIKEYEILYNK